MRYTCAHVSVTAGDSKVEIVALWKLSAAALSARLKPLLGLPRVS